MEDLTMHPEARAYIDAVAKLNLKRYHQLSVEDARARHETISRNFSGKISYEGQIEDIKIPCTYLDSGIPARLYKPDGREESCPIIVYSHGGGHTVGSINSYDSCCRLMSLKCKAIVLSIGYRLAPEYKWPAQPDDCLTAVNWVLQNKDQIGGSKKSKVGISGDSAGGHISATTAHDVKDLDFQILIYPKVCSYVVPSIEKYGYSAGLSRADAEWFYGNYIQKDLFDPTDPRLFPIHRSSFKGLPKAMIIIAEIDPVADESREYIKKFKEAGEPVRVVEVNGVVHGFFHLIGRN
ncbi:DgyrCDS6954 [Dimorphilus gyrociliatus]|uniref:DgyrCDS6954 n=1 Tax=Dimorphilus gyrociliatus TaxID=2664684 RepID=A0A7I8VPS3_9ANNE|nr:DgyrCDS6954 [Dimorphilus gyrociliatus]